MSYKGVIIEESLSDKKLLEEVRILDTEIEPVTESMGTPWLKQWTLHTVEISEGDSDKLAEKLSKILLNEPSSWYADYKDDSYHFIVFPSKIFKVDLKNPELYSEARKYGISIGIPAHQVDFAPTNKN